MTKTATVKTEETTRQSKEKFEQNRKMLEALFAGAAQTQMHKAKTSLDQSVVAEEKETQSTIKDTKQKLKTMPTAPAESKTKQSLLGLLSSGLDFIYSKTLGFIIKGLAAIFTSIKNAISNFIAPTKNLTPPVAEMALQIDSDEEQAELEELATHSPIAKREQTQQEKSLMAELGETLMSRATDMASDYLSEHQEEMTQFVKDNADKVIPAVYNGIREKAQEVIAEKKESLVSSVMNTGKSMLGAAASYLGSWLSPQATAENHYTPEVSETAQETMPVKQVQVETVETSTAKVDTVDNPKQSQVLDEEDDLISSLHI